MGEEKAVGCETESLKSALVRKLFLNRKDRQQGSMGIRTALQGRRSRSKSGLHPFLPSLLLPFLHLTSLTPASPLPAPHCSWRNMPIPPPPPPPSLLPFPSPAAPHPPPRHPSHTAYGATGPSPLPRGPPSERRLTRLWRMTRITTTRSLSRPAARRRPQLRGEGR